MSIHFITLKYIFFHPIAKPAPLRNCTLRPYSSPSSISAATSMLSNSSSSNLPFYNNGVGNQIVNGGQHLKELNYITTEYVKDRNLMDDKRKSSNSYHHQHQYTSAERKNNMMYSNGKNMSLSNTTQRYNTVQQQQQQQRNNTNNINFSDNKSSSNDRYKSNLKSIKRHTRSSYESTVMEAALRNENKRDAATGNRMYSSSLNETKHVNYNKRRTSATQTKNNQYSTDSVDTSISYLRSSSSISSSSPSSSASKYHHVPSAINSYGSYNNHISSHSNNPYANTVLTETVEQPTLMELECIAG